MLHLQLPNASPAAPSLLPNACMQMSSFAWQNLLTINKLLANHSR